MVRDENLDFWIKNGYNVLFSGAHGVGKTSIVRDAFNRNKLKWKYFSAATMDPWVDFVGVPRERQDKKGEPYLDLLRVQGLEDVEAFFFDELNRSAKKVRNAVMELIQFRTINGKPFKKLKVIWAAINPEDDDTYDVERLDPAQADRFHVKVNVPYKPEKEYFVTKYGEAMARSAIAWWAELPENGMISPRRLDYVLDIYQKGGDIRFSLPDQCNASKLLTTLKHGPVHDILEKLRSDKDLRAATEFMANENNFQSAIGYVKKTTSMMDFFFPVLSAEKLSVLASESGPLKYMLDNIEQQKYAECIHNIYKTGTDTGAVRVIREVARKSTDVAAVIGQKNMVAGVYRLGIKVESAYWSKRPSPSYPTHIKHLVAKFLADTTTLDRKNIYDEIIYTIPSTLSQTEAIDTLKCLDGIARRSHSTTVERLDHIMGVVNHCFGQISRHTGQSLEKIVTKHRDQFSKLWQTILKNDSMSAKVDVFHANSK